jgi:hypothetical protein
MLLSSLGTFPMRPLLCRCSQMEMTLRWNRLSSIHRLTLPRLYLGISLMRPFLCLCLCSQMEMAHRLKRFCRPTRPSDCRSFHLLLDARRHMTSQSPN